MRLKTFFITVFLLGLGFDARAQVSQDLASMPEAWQLTLDVIKSKAQVLLIENNGKQVEYRKLIDESQKLQQAIDVQRTRNDQMVQFIKDRHGRTDQQIRMEGLTATVRAKRKQIRDYGVQLSGLQKKKADLDYKIQRLKYTISDIELHQQAPVPKIQAAPGPAPFQVDDQLIRLRKQLEEASRQEVLLENELGALKTGGKTQNLNVAAINLENGQLEARLEVLRLQKLRQTRESSDTQLSQANARLYEHLKKRKDQLETEIFTYEARMDALRQSSVMALSWPVRKKKLVHTMVELDTRNNQMRNQIKGLREDIDVLKDQVARLERRLDFAEGKNGQQQGDRYVQN